MERIKTTSKVAIYLLLSLMNLVSCAMDADNSYLGCWVTMEKTGSTTARIRVRLENDSGNVPTGARVLLETPAGAISWLYYNASSNLYETTLSSPVSGNYIVSVESSLGKVERKISYVSLSDIPNIQTVQDAAGTIAGSDVGLDATKEISLSWDGVPGATVYQGTVTNGANMVLVFSTIDTVYPIAPDTLQPDKTYALMVTAQYIAGDPYLRESDYYVFSYSESPEFYFGTNK